MSLYTKKGDSGTTKLFDSESGVRISKSEFILEALGSLDELNAALGYAKVLTEDVRRIAGSERFSEIVEKIQNQLFSVQGEVAGAPTRIKKEDVDFLESEIALIEANLPPINSFIIPGGTQAGAYFDITRTQARKAERNLIHLHESGKRQLGPSTLAYMNRLSSILYALARLTNTLSNKDGRAPSYN